MDTPSLTANPTRRGSSVLRAATSRPQLLASSVAALVVYLLEPASWHHATRLLIAWNVGTILDISLNLRSISRATPASMRWQAAATEDGKWAILALTSAAVVVALAAIFAQLAVTKHMHGERLTPRRADDRLGLVLYPYDFRAALRARIFRLYRR